MIEGVNFFYAVAAGQDTVCDETKSLGGKHYYIFNPNILV